MAAAGTFYKENEFYDLQNRVKQIVPDILDNSYFRSYFEGLHTVGKLTYIPAGVVSFGDIREFFQKLVS